MGGDHVERPSMLAAHNRVADQEPSRHVPGVRVTAPVRRDNRNSLVRLGPRGCAAIAQDSFLRSERNTGTYNFINTKKLVASCGEMPRIVQTHSIIVAIRLQARRHQHELPVRACDNAAHTTPGLCGQPCAGHAGRSPFPGATS